MTAPSRDVKADLREVIERTIAAHPRSQQAEIGASEVGTECTRKLAHKIAGTPRARPEVPGWRPTVGTAVHTWLEAAFKAENVRLGWERFLTEIKVTVGMIGGHDIKGHCDLYDVLTKTVVDWKIPGITTVKKVRRARHPGRQYRDQAHLYGKGYEFIGLPVEHVAIFFLPAAGELGDGYFWTEPYDEAVAVASLARADGLAAGMRALGTEAIIPQLPTAPDYCQHCPWWMPGATDLRVACPGEAEALRTPPKDDGPVFGRVAS